MFGFKYKFGYSVLNWFGCNGSTIGSYKLQSLPPIPIPIRIIIYLCKYVIHMSFVSGNNALTSLKETNMANPIMSFIYDTFSALTSGSRATARVAESWADELDAISIEEVYERHAEAELALMQINHDLKVRKMELKAELDEKLKEAKQKAKQNKKQARKNKTK